MSTCCEVRCTKITNFDGCQVVRQLRKAADCSRQYYWPGSNDRNINKDVWGCCNTPSYDDCRLSCIDTVVAAESDCCDTVAWAE